MARTKHTPGPWSFDGLEIQDRNGFRIATLIDWQGEAKANAEFIVRACNAHDGLVEALKVAREYIKASDEVLVKAGTPEELRPTSPHLKMIDDALAKARGT